MLTVHYFRAAVGISATLISKAPLRSKILTFSLNTIEDVDFPVLSNGECTRAHKFPLRQNA
jgi:hypothetical protein